jgi:glycine dehydrogenase subunit 2
MAEPTLYELSAPEHTGIGLPDADVPETPLPKALLRDDNGLPELSELDVVRHFQRLSQRNFGVDSGFYPLGSCTMKYNPRINEAMASLPEFSEAHPLANETEVQGCLALMHDLQTWLAEIGGFATTSLQPSAGAHGELTALLMMRRYHADHGNEERVHVLIPDSAHGTNPASTTMAGLTVLEIPSDIRGNVDLDALTAACDDTVAGLMLTNPNTLGLFEERIEDVVRIVHGCGALVYGDGANMNALTGIARPGDLGIDLMHYNLHKTFATPHGGGGPGAGPLAASATLAPYLPGPLVTRSEPSESDEPPIYGWTMPERSIGRMTSFASNFGMLVRAYVYILMHGATGLKQNAIDAVLNANYLRVRLADIYPVPFDRMAMHEFVCEGRVPRSATRAIDICKRLMDYGFHPPTSYFPLIVREALMIEPTETESKAVLDAFVDAMRQIADEAKTAPEKLRQAPHKTPVRRLDEVRAARELTVADQH